MANSTDVPRLGRRLVAGEMVVRGLSCVSEFRAEHRVMLSARRPDGGQATVIVKVRRSGDWQATTNDGRPEKTRRDRYWVFVDLSNGEASPEYFIAPDEWVRDDIQRDHAAYLQRHGGERAESQESTHHAIESWRVAEWANRWDLLGAQS